MKTIIKWIGLIASCIASVLIALGVFFLAFLPYLLWIAILGLVVFGLWKVVI